ncbi:MAG TPA: hypothetical protein VKP65_06560 [Rhodothermales bacterium]|nr:hypothetical protein [Rhodothermales bacterium]
MNIPASDSIISSKSAFYRPNAGNRTSIYPHEDYGMRIEVAMYVFISFDLPTDVADGFISRQRRAFAVAVPFDPGILLQGNHRLAPMASIASKLVQLS